MEGYVKLAAVWRERKCAGRQIKRNGLNNFVFSGVNDQQLCALKIADEDIFPVRRSDNAVRARWGRDVLQRLHPFKVDDGDVLHILIRRVGFAERGNYSDRMRMRDANFYGT